MALIQCGECGGNMSSEAPACPSCGKPNKAAVRAKENSRQSLGCLIIVLSFFLIGFSFVMLGPAGYMSSLFIFLIGMYMVAANTRLSDR